MTNGNFNLLAVMFFLMFVTGVTFFFSSYYGYHRYHFYVEYKEQIITRLDIYSVNELNASGFVYLKRSDFIKGQPYIMNLIHKLTLENCGNCTIETNNFQLKSLSKLD